MAAADDPFGKDDDSDGDLIVLKRDSLAKVSKMQKFDDEEKPPSEAQMTKTVVLALQKRRVDNRKLGKILLKKRFGFEDKPKPPENKLLKVTVTDTVT